MTGYTPLALAHAARRGYRRSGPDVRTAIAHEIVTQIESDYRSWRDSVGRHPADEAADRCIANLRHATGAWRALRRRPLDNSTRRVGDRS